MENNIFSDSFLLSMNNRETEEDHNVSLKPFRGNSTHIILVGCAQDHALTEYRDDRIIEDILSLYRDEANFT